MVWKLGGRTLLARNPRVASFGLGNSFEQTSIRSESVEQHLSLFREDAIEGGELDEALFHLPQLMVLDGLRPMYHGPASGAVTSVRPDLAHSVPNMALSLCPFIARELGLTQRPSDPLSLVDQDGNLAVQVLWWRDGGIFRRGHDKSVRGNGFMVLANDKTMASLRPYLGAKWSLQAWRTVTSDNDADGKRVAKAHRATSC